MIKEHERPKVFSALVLFFKINGQILFKPKILSYLWVIINFLGVFHLMVLHAKTTYDEFKARNLESICDTAVATLIYGFSSFTYIYWMVRQRALNEIIEFIEQNQREKSLEGITFVESKTANAKQRRWQLIWESMCLTGVMCWGAVPLITGKRVLPLNCWYPMETTTPVVYEALYFLQLFGQFGIGITFGNGSALFMALVMVLCGQFDVLFASLKNMYYQADRMSNKRLPEHENPMNEIDYVYSKETKAEKMKVKTTLIINSDYQSLLKTCFKKCIDHHKFILEAARKFEDLFYPYCLIKTLQITLQLCFLVFLMVSYCIC